MKLVLMCVLPFVFVLAACSLPGSGNPFFEEYDNEFGIPPFDKIKIEHYMPAFTAGMEEQITEVDAIVNNSDAPTFENTIEALEFSGALRNKVSNVFFNLTGANTNEGLQGVQKEVAPLLAAHGDNIALNEKLFERVKTVHDQRESLELNIEQARLLEDTYKDFVRGGANVAATDKARYREINSELSLLSVKFGENLLKETNGFEMILDNEADLAGLPESVVAAAAEAAGEAGKWKFTVHKPSLLPFLTYSEKRDLREKMFMAYNMRGDNGNENDNNTTITKIAALRSERAKLLGFETHANFIHDNNMSKTPENVYALLQKIWDPALKMAKQEVYDMQSMIKAEGGDFMLEPWDWWFYSEKVRKEKYALDDAVLRPYFKLENVRGAMFYVANKLWGITFTEVKDMPRPHPDVVVFEVKEADGTHIGLLMQDYHPRESKRGGAWMNSIRKQHRTKGEMVAPIITTVYNVTGPSGDTPALLSFDETSTMFHEFGHALHGLFSNCTYESLSGTSVPRDFVETFSQILEYWASEPEIMKQYAKHYQTGEVIPAELIDKIIKSGHFNQGFVTIEYLAASLLDLDWHTMVKPKEVSATEFENASIKKMGLIDEIFPRYRSTFFNHIWASGYSAGYYSYIWAEVFATDAFEAFVEEGILNMETGKRFRDNLLSRGGTEDAMTIYKRFRGAEPSPNPLLKRRGLN